MASAEPEFRAIVIDNGSFSLKAGLSGEDNPSQVIRSLKSQAVDEDVRPTPPEAAGAAQAAQHYGLDRQKTQMK